MAPGRWLSSHWPTDGYKEVRGAHQTADGSIWSRSGVSRHCGHLSDADEVNVFPECVQLSEGSEEELLLALIDFSGHLEEAE